MNCRICNSQKIKPAFNFDGVSVMKCRDCDIMFYDTMPAKKELLDLYSNENYIRVYSSYFFYDGSQNKYSGNNKHLINYHKILDKINFRYNKKGRMLDIGCATGAFLDLAKKRGWQTKGVEVSRFFADYGKEHFSLDIFCGEIHDANFENKYFDCITCWDILEHIPDPVEWLREIRRILKDDGIIYIWTINTKSILNYIGCLLYKISFGRIFNPVKKLYGFQDFCFHHLYFFSPCSLRHILEKCGFSVLEIKQEEYVIDRMGVSLPMSIILHIIYILQNFFNLKTEVTAFAKKKI